MSDNYQYLTLIYSRGENIQVWKGINTIDQSEVVIKIIFFPDINEANQHLQEATKMSRFMDTEGVAHFYDLNISQSENRYFVRLIMKYYSRGDLKSEIQKRIPGKIWFSQDQLMFNLKLTIDTLAGFQEKNIAHRDIKPENIFISDEGTLLIGDLGCANEFRDANNSLTIAGTPLYLSPRLKEAFIRHLTGQPIKLVHNVYKSDVFSLGLTFLYMLTLEDNTKFIHKKQEEFESEVNIILNRFLGNYRDFVIILDKMLKYDEEQRLDFIELSKLFHNPPDGIRCEFCKKLIGKDYYYSRKKYHCFGCETNELNRRNIQDLDAHIPMSLFQSLRDCHKCKFIHSPSLACMDSSIRFNLPAKNCSCGRVVSFSGSWLKCESCGTYCNLCFGLEGMDHYTCVVLLNSIRKTNWGYKSDFTKITQ